MSATSHPTGQGAEGSAQNLEGAHPAPTLATVQSRIELAELLGVPHRTLTWMLYGRGTNSYYQTWFIKKKSGGVREISAPRSTLYQVQKTLNSLLQDAYSPKAGTQGFVKSRNVVTNARPHVNRRFVLNVDLVDFFPTIHFGRVRGLFKAPPFNCSDQVAGTLAHLCCNHGSLPIGAPTSPVISNMICRGLDTELQKLAKRTGCWYSRYADDLTFSTNRSAFPAALARFEEGVTELGDALRQVIETNGFLPNPSKTRLQTKGNRQVVTGVLVNERLNVDRRYLRRIRAMLHAWDRHGLEAAQAKCEEWYTKDRHPGANPQFVDILRGRIAYAAMVRGSTDPVTTSFKMQFVNLKAGRPIKEGIPLTLVEESSGGVASSGDPAMAALSNVASDVFDRWKDRTGPIAEKVLHAIKLYRGAQHKQDVLTAVVQLASALELVRSEVKKVLKKDEGTLFNVFNDFGLRHLKANQKTDYGVEFLVWIFHICLHTINLVDQIEDRPGSETSRAETPLGP